MRVLILCNGPEVLINGVCKQLLPVDGVPVLHRTLQQLADRDVEDVHIITWDRRLMFWGYPIHSPQENGQPAGLSSSHLWNQDGPTVLLLGDVYYTDAAMDTILEHPAETWTFFCRFGYNPDGSLGGGEGWAVKFPPWDQDDYLRVLRGLSKLDLPVKHFWQQYRMMNAADPSVHRDLGYRVIIDDLTEDFDTPESYHSWLAKRGRVATTDRSTKEAS